MKLNQSAIDITNKEITRALATSMAIWIRVRQLRGAFTGPATPLYQI